MAKLAQPNDDLLYLSVNPTTGDATNVVLAKIGADIRIRVCQLAIVCKGANDVTFTSEGTSNVSPLWSFADKGGLILPYNRNGYFHTVANEDLRCTLANATPVGILIGYKLSTI